VDLRQDGIRQVGDRIRPTVRGAATRVAAEQRRIPHPRFRIARTAPAHAKGGM
jgi:hypothetical protein